jgi:YidC/Oxa1 family membrane protein insertase
MSVLEPLSHVLATVVSTAHGALTSLGADPGSGATWVLAVAAVVLVVRLALLPLVAHGVRMAHSSDYGEERLRQEHPHKSKEILLDAHISSCYNWNR